MEKDAFLDKTWICLRILEKNQSICSKAQNLKITLNKTRTRSTTPIGPFLKPSSKCISETKNQHPHKFWPFSRAKQKWDSKKLLQNLILLNNTTSSEQYCKIPMNSSNPKLESRSILHTVLKNHFLLQTPLAFAFFFPASSWRSARHLQVV